MRFFWFVQECEATVFDVTLKVLPKQTKVDVAKVRKTVIENEGCQTV